MGTRQSNIRVGDRFGRLEVVEKLPKADYDTRSIKRTLYKCLCDCGAFKIVDAGNLKKATKSCGCLKRENARKQGKIQRTTSTFLRDYYGSYRRAARYSERVFEITFEQFSNLVQKDCTYCGEPPENRGNKTNVGIPVPLNGIDRIDSSKGYVEGNIVSCCSRCNRMKLNLTLEEFLMKICKIIEYHSNGTQKEHQEVAIKCKEAIKEYFPTLINMLGSEGDV